MKTLSLHKIENCLADKPTELRAKLNLASYQLAAFYIFIAKPPPFTLI